MARRKTRTRTIYRRAKRTYSRGKSLMGGKTGDLIYGAVAGAASPFIPQVLGGWTNAVAFGAAGYFMKKKALMGIAGYEIGRNLIGMYGGGSAGGDGFFN